MSEHCDDCEHCGCADEEPCVTFDEALRRASWLEEHNAPKDWVIVTYEEMSSLKRTIEDTRKSAAEYQKLSMEWAVSYKQLRDQYDKLLVDNAKLRDDLEAEKRGHPGEHPFIDEPMDRQIILLNRQIIALEEDKSKSENMLQLVRERLIAPDSDSVVGSCDCNCKTPDIRYHRKGCRYRLITERDQFAEELSKRMIG
jgi:hypothetical protein